MAPIACYTCKNFQAWVDGPHEAVLDYLLVERGRLIAEVDVRIATVNVPASGDIVRAGATINSATICLIDSIPIAFWGRSSKSTVHRKPDHPAFQLVFQAI